jgi:hypothetical protein
MDSPSLVMQELRLNVRSSKGWWTRMAAQSGCKVWTLHRIANEPDYDPRFSEALKIMHWFARYGVKTVGPQGKPQASPRQIDLEELMFEASAISL